MKTVTILYRRRLHGNPDRGLGGILEWNGREKELPRRGGTTNNRMELTAVIRRLAC